MRWFGPRHQPRPPLIARRVTLDAIRALVLRTVALVLATLLATMLVACDGGGASSTSTDAGGAGGAGGVSQTVTFTADDGVVLGGHLFGTGSKGVILAHMYPADQTSWCGTAEKLAAQGYLVLTFDFRGYGESEGDKAIDRIDRDVMAAAQEITRAGATEVVLVGASMGGTACLAATWEMVFASMISSQYPPPYSTPVLGVVSLSAPVEFKGLSAEEAVPMLSCPLLFIAAEDDVGVEGAEALEQLTRNQGDLQIVPGGDHGTDLLEGAAADEVWALLGGFLAENLPLDAPLP